MAFKPDIVFRGGRLIDPQVKLDSIADLLIRNGRIESIGGTTSGVEEIDISGKIVLPGLFDMHVHLGEPGREDTESIASGCKAAAAGGFTGIACMPDTDPPVDTSGIVEFILKRAQGFPVEVHPIAAVSKGRAGERLAEMFDLIQAGAAGFSDDPSPIKNSELLRRALEYASDLNSVIIEHAEDPYFADGVMHEGIVSTRLGLAAVPAMCEEIAVMRDIRIAEYTGGALHFAHLSAAESVRHIRAAKARGVRVTAEVTPHNLFLTDEAVIGYDTNTKVNPPLRGKEHREALQEGLLDGTIDAIASDHYPHAIEDKEDDFNSAPYGVVGLETALGLMLTELLHSGRMSWQDLVWRMSVNPRKILGLKEVKIAQGGPANLTIIDPAKEWIVNPAEFKSLSRNTPFAGRELKGKAYAVYNNSQLALSE